MAEVEFRTGPRQIPDYLADLMRGIETFKMTYEEAVAEANAKMLRSHVSRAYDSVVRDHFRQGDRR